MSKISVLFENPKYELNVSAIARTCDFFGVDFYITNPAKFSLKQSAGVTKHKKPKLLNARNWGGRVIITDSSFEVHPQDFTFQEGDLLVFGNESMGISDEIKNLSVGKLGLQSKGFVPCLNVASAVASFLALIEVQTE